MNRETYFVGVDPDTHNTPIAIIDGEGRPVHLSMVKIHKNLKGEEAIEQMIYATRDHLRSTLLQALMSFIPVAGCVEGQEFSYTSRIGASVKSVAMLGNISGAWFFCLCFASPLSKFRIVKPQEWKGQVPKQVHHARMLARMGLPGIAKSPSSPYVAPDIKKFSPDQKDFFSELCCFEKEEGFGAWKHAMDAIGLAIYAKDSYAKANRIQTSLVKARSKLYLPPAEATTQIEGS